MDHQTPVLIRQGSDTALGKLGHLERRDLSSREVPGELERIICDIWVEGGQSIRQRLRVRLDEERTCLVDLLPEFRELLYLRILEEEFQFCRPRRKLRPDDQCGIFRRIRVQLPSSCPAARHSGYIIVSDQCPIGTSAYQAILPTKIVPGKFMYPEFIRGPRGVSLYRVVNVFGKEEFATIRLYV